MVTVTTLITVACDCMNILEISTAAVARVFLYVMDNGVVIAGRCIGAVIVFLIFGAALI